MILKGLEAVVPSDKEAIAALTGLESWVPETGVLTLGTPCIRWSTEGRGLGVSIECPFENNIQKNIIKSQQVNLPYKPL